MKVRARIFLFVVICLGGFAGLTFAECPGDIEKYFYPEEAYGQDISVSGDYLYFAVDHDHWYEGDYLHLKPGLQIWNVANPASPSYGNTVSAGDAGQDANGWVVEVSGSVAYVGFGGGEHPDVPGGILFVNISNPASPSSIAVYTTPANEGVRALAIQGSYAYAMFYDDQNGNQFHVLNISDPTQVSDVAQIATPVVEPEAIAVSGNYVYLATGPWDESNGNGGLWVVDVSTPNQPTVVTKHTLPFPGDGSSIWAPALALQGDFVYLTYSSSGIGFGTDDHWDHAGLQIVNISNPLHPVDGGAVEIGSDLFPYDITLGDEFAYLTAGRNGGGGTPTRLGLVAINIHNPVYPVLAGDTPVGDPANPGIGIWRNAVTGDYAFGLTGGSSYSRTSVIDISGCIETDPPDTYMLTVSKSGAGSGTVSGVDGLIQCGADCTEIYEAGTVVTLTATPDSGSIFTGWSDPCSGTGDCIFMMKGNQTVTATFQKTLSYLLWTR